MRSSRQERRRIRCVNSRRVLPPTDVCQQRRLRRLLADVWQEGGLQQEKRWDDKHRPGLQSVVER